MLILISQRPDDGVFSQSAALEAGLQLKQVSTPKEAVPFISSGQVKVIFADTSTQEQYEAFESALQESIGLFSDLINANAIHFLNSDDLEKVEYLIQSPLFGHFILRNYTEPSEAGKHYARILKATASERAFGLRSILGENAQIQTVGLKNSTDKQNAVEAVKRYLMAAKFNSRMASIIANAVDELLMNAIFDAPVDEVGKQLLSTTSRATPLDLQGKHAVKMEVGFDGKYVGVTVIDLFGSLDKVKLLTHISKIYTDEEYKVKTTGAGAGIGLATVFRSGGSFFFVSESHSRTEVTVFFRRTDNFREFKNQFRFISTQFYF